MKFTIKDMVKRKSFIISTILILLLVLAGVNIPNIIKLFKGEDTLNEKIIISDIDNIFDGKLEALKNANLKFEYTFENESEEKIKEKIQNKSVDTGLLIKKGEKDNSLDITYFVENTAMTTPPQELLSSINALYTNMQIAKLGITQEQIEAMNPNVSFEIKQSKDEEVKGNVAIMMILSFILFFAIYYCAIQVSTSITTEKTSKIMETLVTSTSPKTIVIGKTLGVGIVGLIQLIIILIFAYVGAKIFVDPELLNSLLNVESLNIGLLAITLVYFILGYLLFSFLFALVGSTVSKPEDIQSANAPVALITMVGFYLGYFSMFNPTSGINKFANICPISSPFSMPFRIMMDIASWQDVAISIGLLLITTIVVAAIAIKIYSSAILNYGTKMGLKDMKNILKSKNN